MGRSLTGDFTISRFPGERMLVDSEGSTGEFSDRIPVFGLCAGGLRREGLIDRQTEHDCEDYAQRDSIAVER